MRRNGLSKYDAPLKIQYQWGQDSFFKGKLYKGKKGKFFLGDSGIDPNTMQHREWLRGYNDAYYANLKRVERNEQTRERS
jgi:hypothetical protein|tara:strand:- start:1167 stop:1406 length:240 start_codon:yes stop_codon:yes gene_type:complete